MEGKLTVRTLDKDHCVATWDRVLIQVWRLGVTSESVADLTRVARSFLAEEQPICLLAIVERTSPAPNDSVRAELSKFYRDLASQATLAIVVAVGSGFRAALVRGVGITLSMLAPRILPFKFVASVEEATSLVAPHLRDQIGAAEALRSAIDEVRALLDTTFGPVPS